MIKKFLLFTFYFILLPFAFASAATDFELATGLLRAARGGDTTTVQALINSGADVNYVDNTGMSIVCTAVMNRDKNAVQILQMYGADASKCDRQIKQYGARKSRAGDDGGFFGGLSTTQKMALGAGGVAVVAGGLLMLTDVFDAGNNNTPGGNNTNGVCARSPDGTACSCGGGTSGVCVGGKCTSCTTPGTNGTEWAAGHIPYGPSMPNAESEAANYINNLDLYSHSVDDSFKWDFAYMSGKYADPNQSNYGNVIADPTVKNYNQNNYMLMMHGYSPLARGYNGRHVFRTGANHAPATIESGANPGGAPMRVALVTNNGVNPTGSAARGNINYSDAPGGSYNTSTVDKYWNYDANGGAEKSGFDLSGNNTVFNSASTESDLAKIIAGWEADGRASGDYYGFMPNGQLVVYRTGGGVDDTNAQIDFLNYTAMFASLSHSPAVIANAALLPSLKSPAIPTADEIRAASKDSFLTLVNRYYDAGYYTQANPDMSNSMTSDSPGYAADQFFSALATMGHSVTTPLVVFGTGEYKLGLDALTPREALFENAAPLFYSGLEHKFISAVAVMMQNGTGGYASVSGYSPGGDNKIVLAQYTDSGNTYGARVCGVAGTGANNIDPWCFAAAGNNAAQAVAGMSGAAGVLHGAFDYMTEEQIFLLMALTADGAYLSSDAIGGGDVTAYLQNMYKLPDNYQDMVDDNNRDYLDVFKEVFGYGLVNLARATTPGGTLYFFDGNNIVSTSTTDKAYYSDRFVDTAVSTSTAFGTRSATISVQSYNLLESDDGTMSMPRIWNTDISLGTNGARGLSMTEVMDDFTTSKSAISNQQSAIGNMSFNMNISEKQFADNLSGLDNMRLGYDVGAFSVAADYQRNFTDSASRYSATSNPILSLASNAMSADMKYKSGKWEFGGRAFSGAITDELLLQNDPTISGMYEPARLGLVSGAESSVGVAGEKFGFTTSVGTMRESDTLLGAMSGGLLDLGAGDTTYIDSVMTYRPTDLVALSLRGTFAHTTSNATGELVMGLSDIESNAFSISADIGNFEFSLAAPLAVTGGTLRYAHSDFGMTKNEDGNFDLVINDTGVRDFNLMPDTREVRFSGAYRHKFGEFTDGAFGFIYRVNPNHTAEFGDEAILMFKLKHRLGI